MKKELIEKIKEEIVDLKYKQKIIRDSIVELDELKQNQSVKRFLELLEFDTEKNRRFIIKNEIGLLGVVYNKYGRFLNENNNIYFCMGTYTNSNKNVFEQGFGFFALDRDDPRALFRIYINLENESDYIKVPIEECELFEIEHKVIFPKYSCVNFKEYYKVSEEFFRTIILEGQDVAIEKVLSLKKNV